MRDILVWLDTIAPALSLFIGLFLLRNGFVSGYTRLIILYLTCTFLLNGISNVISEFYEINNHLLYHSENILNFIFLSLYFSSLLPLKAYRQHIRILTFILCVANIIYKLVQQNYFQFDSTGFGVGSFIFTLYAMAYYMKLLATQNGDDLFKMPDFWIVTGILLYYASSFFIFILYNHYIGMDIDFGILWWFQNIMLTIMCFFFIKGLVCRVSRTSLSL